MKYISASSYTALLICLIFSVFFTFFCGPVGHAGDAWNFIYTTLYAEDFFNPNYIPEYWLLQRPVEYAIQVWLLLKWFGLAFNTQAIHFYALLFLLFSAFFFGRILEKIYPDEPLFVVIILLFMFFHSPSFASTFRLNTSTSLLSAVFFWCAGLFFFKLARTRSWFWGGLFAFISLGFYLLSIFSYENFVLVIFIFPFCVYFAKTWSPQVKNVEKVKQVILRAVFPATGIFATLLLIKYVFLRFIGRQTNVSVLPLFKGLWNYWLALLIYEVDVVKEVAASNSRYLALLLLVFLYLFTWNKKHIASTNYYTPLLIGGIIFFLGSFPYIIAGYKIDLSPGYPVGARELSSASFGFVLIVSGLLLIKKPLIFHAVSKFLLLLLLACHIAFTFILADAWKEATRFQKSLFTSLLEACPDVEDGSRFIFLDGQSFVGSKASVFGGPLATTILPQIIYNNRTLRGGLAYSGEGTYGERTTIVTPDSIKPRTFEKQFLLDNVIILKNTHYTFEVVDLQKTDSLNVIWAESYFELNKDAMHRLEREGVPEEIVEDLKPLKHQAFFKEDFLEAIKEEIGKENTEKYQSLILRHSWNWTEESFMLTEQDMQSLREDGVPETTLTWLVRVKNRTFPTEKDFLEAAEDYIGKEARERYRELFVKHARKKVNSITKVKSNAKLIKQQRVENAFTKYLESLPD